VLGSCRAFIDASGRKEFLMSIRRFLLTTALAAFTSLPLASGAWAGTAGSSQCLPGAVEVTRVAPVYGPSYGERSGSARLAGARVFLPARPGLTAEWIAANLSRGAASERKASTPANCPLDVPGAAVKVVSGGTGFWVQITARDGGRAEEILNRARRLVR
jgi:hypothetical protein